MSGRFSLALTSILVMAYGTGCAILGENHMPVPEIKKQCITCHSSNEPSRNSATLNKPLSGLCLDCHPDRKPGLEHTVDVIPSMSVVTLPLTEGKMTCVTCHDPHKNRYGNMLRIKPKELCLRCHRY